MTSEHGQTVGITDEQKRSFLRDGFLKLPGMVDSGLVHAALRAINHSLGYGGIAPSVFTEPCPDLDGSEDIDALLNRSPLFDVVRQMVGSDVRRLDGVQIAIRFPRDGDPSGEIDYDAPVERLTRLTPHIDGAKRMPKVNLPASRQVLVGPGDAILAHYMLGHGVAENLSPDIRYTVYFRFNSRVRDDAPKNVTGNSDRDVSGFTGLLGVYLSDVTGQDKGNLTVWPGSHHLYQRYYASHEDEARQDFLYPGLLKHMWREWEGLSDVIPEEDR